MFDLSYGNYGMKFLHRLQFQLKISLYTSIQFPITGKVRFLLTLGHPLYKDADIFDVVVDDDKFDYRE